MADALDTQEPDAETRPDAFVTYWLGQLKAYDEEFQSWVSRSKKIIRRYRDERGEKQDGRITGVRFNALWSNVQTLLPAVYSKAPQPVAERRFLDKDPVARIASMTLERAAEVQIDVGYFHPTMRAAVLDYLLCGRGTMWERYEPTYGEPEGLGPDPEDEEGGEEPAEAPKPVTYEKVCSDYVAWDKFKHSPSPTWEEVWWVAKEEMLTRQQLRKRFKGKDPHTGKLIADLIPLRNGVKDKQNDREKKSQEPKALVVEIWDKSKREVVFIAPDWTNGPLERTEDPLQLQGFWPCPKPLYATVTNDCLVPVPDYVEYQDQAEELDDLTARIDALTDAIRVNGVYDASYPELKRILSEGVDNRMIGVKNYAEFSAKGGLKTALDFIPIKDVVEALIRLYEARERTKADMAEITGLSDIVRGQAQGTAKTATEQRIKGQFASLRLDDRKKEVARFARDGIAIACEIISEQFSPQILAEMTGMIPFIIDEIKVEMPAQPAPAPQMGHNGGPPLEAAPGVSPSPGNGAAGGAPPLVPGMQPPQPDIPTLAAERFSKAIELLRNDKMRTFRIDIETDSTIEIDKQQAKEAATELVTAVGGLLEKAIPIVQVQPALIAPIGQTLMWVMRSFGAGRDVEGVWEAAVDELTKAAKNPGPKPPSPEEIKAKAEADKQAAETQRMAMEMENERQRDQMQAAAEERQAALKERMMNAEAAHKERMIALKEREAMIGMATKVKTAEIEAHSAERQEAIQERGDLRQEALAERADQREAEAGERDFELQDRVAKAKAKEAMKPKAKEPA